MTKIKTKSAFTLTTMSLLGAVILTGVDLSITQRLYLVGILIVLGITIAFLAANIVAKNPQKSLFEIMDQQLHKPFNVIAKTIFAFSALAAASIVLAQITRFFGGAILIQTPSFIIGLFLVAIAAYLAKSGALTLAKWAVLAIFGGAITFIFITIFTLRLIDFENLNFTQTANFNLSNLNFILLIAIIIPLILATTGDHHSENKPYKSILLSITVAIGTIFVILLRDVLILGAIIEDLPFPSHTVARLARHSTSIDISAIVSIIFAAIPIGLIALAIFALDKFAHGFMPQKTNSKLTIPLLSLIAYLLSQVLLMADFTAVTSIFLLILGGLNLVILTIFALFAKKPS